LESLLVAAHRALQIRSDTRSANDIVPPFSLTIEDQIELITETLRQQSRVSFSELLTSAYSRYEVVVTLLALLELIKQRRILAHQERVFGEIALLRLE
jgi:segregation and condensation protein A